MFAPNHWQTVMNLDAGNTEVLSYPDIASVATTNANLPKPITDYASIKSTYVEAMQRTPGRSPRRRMTSGSPRRPARPSTTTN